MFSARKVQKKLLFTRGGSPVWQGGGAADHCNGHCLTLFLLGTTHRFPGFTLYSLFSLVAVSLILFKKSAGERG